MSWISRLKELSKALKVEEELLLHEEFQKQTLRVIYLDRKLREITLHGGTALRLIYGSPRFSLDLDFTGKPLLDLPNLPREVVNSIKSFGRMMGFDVELAGRKISGNKHNFLRFNLNFSIAGIGRKLKVKVELLEKEFTRRMRKELYIEHPIPTVIYVRTKALSDILVDKVCAIAGKSYVLPRNVYDVDFIVRNGGKLEEKRLLEEFGEWKETREGLKKALHFLRRADHKMIVKEINMLLPEGAKISLEDADMSVETTLKVLEEAMEILHD